MIERIRIGARFCGPPDTGNGGYVGGRLARHLQGAVEVTLRAATPLDQDLELVSTGEGALALRRGELELASARQVPLDLELPRFPGFPPGFDQALEVRGACRAFQTHPFPHCFVCGPARAPGDGLCIYPGMLGSIAAAAWLPDASLCDESGFVDDAYLWSALDCTSSFPLLEDPASQALEPLVLGRLVVECRIRVEPDTRLVVAAWSLGFEGRRGQAGSALFLESGECVARGRATWISIAGR